MPIPVTMPALSPTMTEGRLAAWRKREGDAVVPGDVLAELHRREGISGIDEKAARKAAERAEREQREQEKAAAKAAEQAAKLEQEQAKAQAKRDAEAMKKQKALEKKIAAAQQYDQGGAFANAR